MSRASREEWEQAFRIIYTAVLAHVYFTVRINAKTRKAAAKVYRAPLVQGEAFLVAWRLTRGVCMSPRDKEREAQPPNTMFSRMSLLPGETNPNATWIGSKAQLALSKLTPRTDYPRTGDPGHELPRQQEWMKER